MTDSIAQTSTTSQDEAPFKAFETAFAKRICTIAGVEKLSELRGQQVTRRDEECGVIATVTKIVHFKKNEFEPELIELYLEKYSEITIDVVRLFNPFFIPKEGEPNDFASGAYSMYIGTDDIILEESSVGIGPHDRPLVTLDGKIADKEGITGIAEMTGYTSDA